MVSVSYPEGRREASPKGQRLEPHVASQMRPKGIL
jgi:hypothetical protein